MPEPTPSASVILTTYNSPKALERVLWGYFCQDRKDFEIIVADDGSGAETLALMRALQSQSPVPLVHVWQEDDGFQKCRILNKAIVCARSDYLIISDGDCIPRADFVSTHLQMRKPGHYLSGGLFRLSAAATEVIGVDDVKSQAVFDPAWLVAHGQPNRSRKFWKLTRNRTWARILEALSPAPASWNGANSSCWKDDAVRVNGFDERMHYGALDREFGVRMVNSGVRTRKVRYSASVVHLEHKRSYNTEAGWNFNRKIRREVAENKLTRTEHGIDTHLGKPREQFLRN